MTVLQAKNTYICLKHDGAKIYPTGRENQNLALPLLIYLLGERPIASKTY